MPLLASTVAQVTPPGWAKSVTGVPAVASCMKACHIGAANSSDMTLLPGARSLLPAHTPATIAGALGSDGGATYPAAKRSSVWSLVPVLSVAGRRVLPDMILYWLHQLFCAGSVLPLRMLVIT